MRNHSLVVTYDTDGEAIAKALSRAGLQNHFSGSGQGGVEAIGRVRPGVIIICFRGADCEDDLLVLRTVQSLFQQEPPFPRVVVISRERRKVLRLLGQTAQNGHCRALTSPRQLKWAVTAPLNQP